LAIFFNSGDSIHPKYFKKPWLLGGGNINQFLVINHNIIPANISIIPANDTFKDKFSSAKWRFTPYIKAMKPQTKAMCGNGSLVLISKFLFQLILDTPKKESLVLFKSLWAFLSSIGNKSYPKFDTPDGDAQSTFYGGALW